MKEKLKKTISQKQNGQCALSGRALPKDTALFDTDRINEKFKGGTYTDENTRGLNPVTHMERHGNLRHRSPQLLELKSLIDAREQLRKVSNSASNRLLALERRTDDPDQRTKEWLEWNLEQVKKEMTIHDRRIVKSLKDNPHPMVEIASKVSGIGPVTISYMLTYVDIEKADTVSSLWAYVGLDKPSHVRYEKNVKGGGNKTLRTVLYTMAESQMKGQSDISLPRYKPYREVYDRAKAQKERSEALVKSRNTQGKLVEVMWKDTKKCHRHGHALRLVIKHFLSDWWFAHRTIEGLSVRPLYVEEKLHHTGIITAKERGWKF